MGAAGAFFGLAGGALAALAVADRPLQLRAGGLKPIGLRQLAGLLRTGLPAIVAFAVYPLAITVNRLVVAESCSLEAAAALGAVNDLVAGPVLLVFHVVNLALMPSVYAAANRGDGPVFERTIWQLVGLQAAMIIPGIAFFLLFGGMIGSVLHLTSLPPVAADMLPYIAIAVLSSVIINTAAGVAVARRKIGLATIYSLAVVGTSILLGLREGCDVLGLARTLTVLMAISSFVGLFFIYRLRKLPGGAEGEAAS
jgi:O-antigen/teichoic acid export membrane protein